MDRKIVVIAHNIRSTHNIGSLLRTCDGLGAKKLYLTGYSPYPKAENDERLPHIAEKLHKQITKTSLGAENNVPWSHSSDINRLIEKLKCDGYAVAALEQTETAAPINKFKAPNKIALLLGEEVDGVHADLLQQADVHLEIPMFGKKESFNVTIAAAIALYQFRIS